MKNYVKVENGVVVKGPIGMSDDPTQSPNIYWGDEQLRKNGFFLVDIDYDKNIEMLDINNPVITNDEVAYKRIPLSIGDLDKLDQINRLRNVEIEMPALKEMVNALWDKIINGDSSKADELNNKIISVKQKYGVM